METDIKARESKSFTYSFTTEKSPEEMYGLFLNIEQWWSGIYEETIKGESAKVGDEFSFLAGGGAHFTKHRLVELVPNTKIVWLVIEGNLTFVEKTDEWVNTKICFDIAGEGDKTRVTFTHEGLTPQFECYDDCSSGWMGYMEKLNKKMNED